MGAALGRTRQGPTFGKDWRLIQTPGYDPEEQTYYHPDHEIIRPVSAHPEEHDVVEARRLICEELLGDFPFISEAPVSYTHLTLPTTERV